MLVLFYIDPVSQDPAYHLFADVRSLFGISNFNNVVSNAGFAIVGVIGVFVILGAKQKSLFRQRYDTWPYLIFFTGVALISVGSSYYHLEPSNERLLWDRLPMSVAFMAFCSAVIADRIHNRLGNIWLLALLVVLGMLSLVYWYVTESQGHGDLRFYAFVQFYPILMLPVVLWLFPGHRYTAGRFLGWVIAWYTLSKVLEYYDKEVFDYFGHIISGHTLKHLAAGAGTLVVLHMLLVNPPSITGQQGQDK
ncbi:MAG: ceramidase domain-containing protein [Pseudomonadota bacterium]|nr:ceramidase domain-containing protein [Pseudomonadota bacterium]